MRENLEFFRSSDLDYVLELMAGEKLKVIAGGTDFMVHMREDDSYLEGYTGILDLTELSELRKIELEDDMIKIGALTTHSDIVNSEVLQDNYPALVQAAEAIGSPQVRSRGTIGGNICNAAACADTFGPLVACDAEVVLASAAGCRIMPAEEFIVRPYETRLEDTEILTSIRLPLPANRDFSNFQKIGRRQAMTIARVSLAVSASFEGEMVENIRVVPGSATPVPRPFSRVEAQIQGEPAGGLNPHELGELAAEEMVNITGERWSTPYKKPALATLVRRAVSALQEEVKNHE